MRMRSKFRAWHNRRNEYGAVAALEWNPDFSLKRALLVFQITVIEPNDDIEEVWCNASDVIVEESTSLHDKNGKEIYEGDIVEVWNSWVRHPVKYAGGRFVPLVQVEDGHNTIDDYSPEDFVVIGNIHDNPELLEAK